MAKHTCPRRIREPEFKDPDKYAHGHGLIGQKRGCTYCGSMSPNDFLDAVKAGARVDPTDKTYKVYLDQDHQHGKFYWGHMSPEQGDDFLRLLAADKVNIGYPGYFYSGFTLPHTVTGCEGTCRTHASANT